MHRKLTCKKSNNARKTHLQKVQQCTEKSPAKVQQCTENSPAKSPTMYRKLTCKKSNNAQKTHLQKVQQCTENSPAKVQQCTENSPAKVLQCTENSPAKSPTMYRNLTCKKSNNVQKPHLQKVQQCTENSPAKAICIRLHEQRVKAENIQHSVVIWNLPKPPISSRTLSKVYILLNLCVSEQIVTTSNLSSFVYPDLFKISPFLKSRTHCVETGSLTPSTLRVFTKNALLQMVRLVLQTLSPNTFV